MPDVKKSERILDQQTIGSRFIPSHKFKADFIEYYQEYVTLNRRNANRHLPCSLMQFKAFIKIDFNDPDNIPLRR